MADLKDFTPTEILIYNYLISHPRELLNLSIRQLADAIHVSSASIIRCIKKMGYDSFYELKFDTKRKEADLKSKQLADNSNTEIYTIGQEFFKRPLLEQYDTEFKEFQQLVENTNSIVFFGLGTSGILAQYGARQFSNFGINSVYNIDPFYPLPPEISRDTNQIALMLSVSGETQENIDRAIKLKEKKFHIVSITNNNYCTLAKLSEINFSYNIKPEVINKTLNITSSLPVIFILESLARNIFKQKAENH
jgi:DNA-binding MurR/RpiR family transcriptional regulator